MSIVSTFLARLRPDLPYMTPAESSQFKHLRAGGAISFFRTWMCAECGAEVPQTKKYCSKKCYEVTNGGHDGEGQR
jgi:hypothetical protein